MALSSTNTTAEDYARTRNVGSAVAWGAVIAGAAAAASLSLILLILGVGLGLSSVSPWTREGISATTFGVSTIVWLTLTQLLASAMGGYLAGRLRTKWTEVHADEVYFRDTAHGFLAWAVASLATAALLTSAIASIVSGGAQAGASVAGGIAGSASAGMGSVAGMVRAGDSGSMGYFVDSLFRKDAAAPAASTASAAGAATGSAITGTPPAPMGADTERNSARDAGEVSRIFMNASLSSPLPAEDARYISQLVAQRTGMSQADAQKRVTDVYTKAQNKINDATVAARDAADKARKASAYSALWLFISLLIGAFIASLSATYGGRRRDA